MPPSTSTTWSSSRGGFSSRPIPYEKPEHPPDWMKTRSPRARSAGWSAMRPLSCSRAASEIVTMDGEVIAMTSTIIRHAPVRDRHSTRIPIAEETSGVRLPGMEPVGDRAQEDEFSKEVQPRRQEEEQRECRPVRGEPLCELRVDGPQQGERLHRDAGDDNPRPQLTDPMRSVGHQAVDGEHEYEPHHQPDQRLEGEPEPRERGQRVDPDGRHQRHHEYQGHHQGHRALSEEVALTNPDHL